MHTTHYAGPPPPLSGTVQLMYSFGILMLQHLQCTQFWALITSSSPSGYSYTRAGQKRVSGAANSAYDTFEGVSLWSGWVASDGAVARGDRARWASVSASPVRRQGARGDGTAHSRTRTRAHNSP